MKITTIIGARPQFIKTAAVSMAISGHNSKVMSSTSPNAYRSMPVSEVIVHTGQHFDDNMSEVFFRELEILMSG